MVKKTFKKTFSDKLKRTLVFGATLLALGGAQEAKAQGLLERITNTLENINHEVNQVNIKISNYNIQKERLKRNIGRFDRNTGGVISGTVNAIAIRQAQKAVERQIQQSGGTYIATQQDFSYVQETPSRSYAYLKQVERKRQARDQVKETIQQNESRTVSYSNQSTRNYRKKAYQGDVNTVLNILNSKVDTK